MIEWLCAVLGPLSLLKKKKPAHRRRLTRHKRRELDVKSVWSPIQFPWSIMYESRSLSLHYHGLSAGNRTTMTTKILKSTWWDKCVQIKEMSALSLSCFASLIYAFFFAYLYSCPLALSGFRRLMQSANLVTLHAVNSHSQHFMPDQSHYFYSPPF